MALSKSSVYEVENFFLFNFPDSNVVCINQNEHGADEVYINISENLQTRQLKKIVECSEQIGNTVSIIADGQKNICICFW